MSSRPPLLGLAALPSRQRGQAMVFVSVTTVMVLLALLVMYSTGQLTTQRMKLQNTADSVAYSAALVQARDLNYAAYMNRAMIANQVAVAQIVSMTGWARGYDDTYNGSFSSIATTLANLSTMSFLWTAPANIYKSVGSGLKSVFNSIGPVLVKVLDVLIKALGVSATAYHYGMTLTLYETVTDVMAANDPNASLSTLGNLGAVYAWGQHELFAKSYNPVQAKDGEDRFGRVVDASSDLFYKNRTLPLTFWPTPMLIDPIRLFTPGVGPLLMFNFHSGGSVNKKPGSTTQDLKSWGSIDATGTFVIFCITISIFGIPIPIPFPLPPLPAGAGAAAAGNYPSSVLMPGSYLGHRNSANTGTDSAAAVDWGGAYINPYTVIPYFIKAGEGPGSNMDSGAGLTSYLDIKGNANNATSNQATSAASGTNYHNDKAPAFFIEVERDSNTVATSNSGTFHIGGGSGQLTLEDKTVDAKIRAMSKAQAYFYRPKDLFARADNKTEYGSLYSPYWQVHLVPNNLLEQAGSIIAPNVLP
ncbi:MAG TPA: pilus assembly protein TadG-related protein [Rhodocyclaceae bacterium]